MRSSAVVMLSCLAIVLASSCASAQDREFPAVGFSASFSSGNSILSFPIWLTRSVTLAPGVSFFHQDYWGQEYSAELALRYNLREYPAVPYIGIQGQLNVYNPKERDAEVGYGGDVHGGGEYFLNRHFSLGVQFRINSEYIPKHCYTKYSCSIERTKVLTASYIMAA